MLTLDLDAAQHLGLERHGITVRVAHRVPVDPRLEAGAGEGAVEVARARGAGGKARITLEIGGEGRDIARAVTGRVGMGHVPRHHRLPGTGMAGHRM